MKLLEETIGIKYTGIGLRQGFCKCDTKNTSNSEKNR
jgi:hypothetical protein